MHFESRGYFVSLVVNLLVCEELTLEKMKSANHVIPPTTSLIAKKASSSCCRPVASLFGCTIFTEIRGWDTWALGYHESSDCFEHPQNSLLTQATQKVLAKFSYPKTSFDLSRHLKSEVPHLSPSQGGKQPFSDATTRVK